MVVQEKMAAAEETDAVLVERAVKGDDRAFTALYFRYSRYVAGIVYSIVGTEDEVDDICQEIFVAVSRKLGALKEPAYFKTWMVTIVVRFTRRRLASQRRRRFFNFRFAGQAGTGATDPRDAPFASDLRMVLNSVPHKLLIPWSLRRLEGMPLEQVATACDVSLATVKRRIAKAEALMKRSYDGI